MSLLTTLYAGNFYGFFLSSADFFFSKLTILNNSFRNIIRVSNTLDPGQARHFVRLDLGTNCLQADDKC